ncbi:MAG: hypothetical protein BAA02_06150 [Paenibacillaceae bacterium ZCTH02-B3]|nr:MAG: hypothetical protein BAA02_06150 [Paenibacillaceae bacterium ZCTH02-B3]
MTPVVNIYISSIRIHAICNLGSLNVGKTILCRNTAQAAWTGRAEFSPSAVPRDAISGGVSPENAFPGNAVPGEAEPGNISDGNAVPRDGAPGG